MDDDRVVRLEASVDELARSVRDLNARLATLEGARASAGDADPPPEAPAAAIAPPPYLAGLGFSDAFGLVGRTFLVLGGAFLLRALTESAVIKPAHGVFLGLAYTALWLLLAERAATSGRSASAAFHGLAAVLTGFPLVWEAGARFAVLSGLSLAGTLAALTAAALGLAWRHRSASLAWCATVAAAAVSAALSLRPDAAILLSWLALALGLATLALAYAGRSGGPRWVAAAAADLAVVRAVDVARHAAGDAGASHAVPAVWTLGVALLAAYVAAFAVRTLAQRRDAGVFEIVQTAAALVVGLGGTIRLAPSAGASLAAIGLVVLAGGAASYAVSFAFVRRKLGRGRNFFFWAWLALVFVLAGLPLVAGSVASVIACAALGVAAAFLGGRFGRATLAAHSAAYAVVATAQEGLFGHAFRALAGAAEAARALPGIPGIAALVGALASWSLLAAMRGDRSPSWLARLARLVLALVGLGGSAALVVALGARALDAPSAGAIAALRTGVLALAAIALAAARRRTSLPELGWIAIALVALGGVKFVLEDLRAGGAATLFPAFVLYGLALILVPRWLRRARG